MGIEKRVRFYTTQLFVWESCVTSVGPGIPSPPLPTSFLYYFFYLSRVLITCVSVRENWEDGG